ncbi:MAG: carboxypeptidase-like regulatory domain-containing protein [Candidatus Acidiferrum sp.]
MWLSLCLLLCGFPGMARAQSQRSPAEGLPSDSVPGTVRGTVVDQTGSVVAGARVRITSEASSEGQEVFTDEGGQFSFVNVAPGTFKLKITAEGFATRTSSGLLRSGDTYLVPQIALIIASAGVELRVTPSQIEVAEDQIKVEEKQRLLGVLPNFYVSYEQHAVPLTSRQKFELAWKTIIDPVNFGVIGAIAGIQQAQNDFSGYGQGAAGYGRRYGANWGNFLTGTYIGGAILPSLLKQDPRYFYKGTGSTRSRVMYAIANAVICKGDNGRWQASYSNILGSLASGGISNLYYPAKNRDGAELTFENALINIGATAATNILQEFVFRKLTPSSRRDAAKSQSIIEEPSTTPNGLVEDRTTSTVYGSPVPVRN